MNSVYSKIKARTVSRVRPKLFNRGLEACIFRSHRVNGPVHRLIYGHIATFLRSDLSPEQDDAR